MKTQGASDKVTVVPAMTSIATDHDGGVLRQFLAWWWRQLKECMPVSWRRPRKPRPRVPVNAEGGLSEESPEDDRMRNGDGKSSPDRAISLLLPAGTILSRTVTLPAAAASDIRQVIGYEFDRLTPFRQDEVVWSLHAMTRHAQAGTLTVELLLAPRYLFENAIEQARLSGFTVASVVSEAPDGQGVSEIPLMTEKPPTRGRWKILAVVALLLACVPFVGNLVHLLRLDHDIAGLSQGVAEAEQLRDRLRGYTAGPSAVAREEKMLGSVSRTLQALTNALPDDTFLTALHVHEHKVTLEGQTHESARLIGLLEHQAGFSGASFSGSVTHSGDTSLDAFTINAVAPE
jgi:general secretion pathway protein L